MKKKLSRKQWWLFGVIVALVLVLIAEATVTFVNRPRDIGPNLEYIGEVNSGCSWVMGIVTFGFCGDRETNHSYLFATNMSNDDLGHYFAGADKVNILPGSGPSIAMTLRKNGKTALVYYYPDAQVFLSENAASVKTQKKYLLEVNKTDYEIVRSSY